MSSSNPPLSRRLSLKWEEELKTISELSSDEIDISDKNKRNVTTKTRIYKSIDTNLQQFDLKNLNITKKELKSLLSNNKCLVIYPKSQNNKNNNNNNKVTDDEKYNVFSLPLIKDNQNNNFIDIRQLYPKKKITTYDPGFLSTAACHSFISVLILALNSAITYIDGKNSILLHRGYNILDLCKHSDFLELSFLLIYGNLPNKEAKMNHINMINKHLLIHEKLKSFIKGFRYNAHPMSILCATVGALSSFYYDTMDIRDVDNRLQSCYRIIAKMPTLAAMAYKMSVGQPIISPKKDLSYSQNLLYMLFYTPSEEYDEFKTKYLDNELIVQALDQFLMLHCDHEQNASTSTVRISGSSHANPYACIASGIACLWGPSHGGANEAVINMLQKIGSKENIPKYIAKAKNKLDKFRLMGFGHRIYKNYDPRGVVLKDLCIKLLNDNKLKNDSNRINAFKMMELALELEKQALNDNYFKTRKLYPNWAFYSGIVLQVIGIPKSMYTVLFAVSRCVGWIAHWKEMIEDPKQRIGRPRQLFLGKTERIIQNKQNLNKE